MKRFLKNIGYFVLPIMFLSYAADVFLSSKLKESKTHAGGEYSTWSDLYKGNLNANILIYGSSRAQVHVSPLIISDSLGRSCYNLGLTGHNFWAQYFRHKELLKYNAKPVLIIHSVDVWTLVKREDLFNPDQFLPYMLFNHSIATFTDAYIGYTTVDFWVPLIRYYGKKVAILHTIKNLFVSQPKRAGRTRGYEGKQATWNNDLVDAQASLNTIDLKIDSLTFTLFDRYIKECQEQKIEIILVYTPEYIEGQQFVKNRDAILDTYRYFSTKYGIPFLDYSNDPISVEKEYFYNASHLNKRGSELFTQKLAQDIKLLRFRTAEPD